MQRTLSCCAALWLAAVHSARAGEPPVPAPDDAAAPSTAADPAAPPAAPAPGPGELIEVTGAAPVPPGTISLDAQVARQTAGALGEPFRALALLPGVTTSVAASGYPVIRGTLPGESRYSFDGIEIPMLYHLVLGNQVIHPSFIGDLELRAGGHGAEQGHLTGGLVAMTPATVDQPRTELRANPIEVGAYRAQRLGPSTTIAAGLRAGTLTLPVLVYDTDAALFYVDQQTRLVHRLDGGDQLTLTSLAVYDHLRQPPDTTSTKTDKLGFHRLDARWTRTRAGGSLRAGIETSIDGLTEISVPKRFRDQFTGELLPQQPTTRQGGRSYGVRAYSDGGLSLAPWLAVRGGVEARHRTLVNREDPFELGENEDPFLGPARTVDAEGAWTAVELGVGPLRITPGIRVDNYRAELYGASVRHVTVDPRLAIAAELPNGARAELAGGEYSAPPQLSLLAGGIMIGPVPMTDGTASAAGMNHGVQAQLSLRTPLAAGLQGNFAAYYRTTHYAVDFAMLDRTFQPGGPCDPPGPRTQVYRDIDNRALGVEAMVRGELGHSVSGWVSYSLAKIDRDFGFLQQPSDFDQRHTLNATVQWQYDRWRLGATGHLHTGRPVVDDQFASCGDFVGTAKSADVLRRVPTNYRLDLRAERPVQLGGWQARLFFELQNATFTSEVLGYHLEGNGMAPSTYHRVEDTLFLPLPLIGLEVVL